MERIETGEIYGSLNRGDPVELIVKLVGETCNLNCTYCYEKRHFELSTSSLNLDLLKKAIDSAPSDNISVGLHGGEPLVMPFEKLQAILKFLGEDSRVRDIKIQTNATLLEKKHIKLLIQYNVQLGVSHDGPPSLPSWRLYYDGRNAEHDVSGKLEELSHAGIPLGIICVVSRYNVDHAENLFRYFSKFSSIKNVSFLPCFDFNAKSRDFRGESGRIIKALNIDSEGRPGWGITPRQYQDFLESFFNIWRNEERITYLVEPFMSVIKKIEGIEPDLCTFSRNKCSHIFTLYPDGRLTGCDVFEKNEVIAEPAKAGAWESVSSSSHRSQDVLREVCASCDVRTICGGGCTSTRLSYYGSPYYQDYCDHRRALVRLVESNIQG